MDNNDAAFPQPLLGESGMSLRDWFAGMALNACLTQTWDSWGIAVTAAYDIADRMLKEREKNG